MPPHGTSAPWNPSATYPFVFPRRKPGSIVPPQELVGRGKLVQLLEKFGAPEPWVAAFAGKAGAEAANFSSRSRYLPSLGGGRRGRVTCGSARNYVRSRPLLDTPQKGQ